MTTPNSFPDSALIWLETESFSDTGGWVNDPQFIEQMGSPYLMAHGIGTPVADAVTRVPVSRPGRYRLWARTKDWCPEFHPGRFQILVDGVPASREFGASGRSGWHWEDGGIVSLTGDAELCLRDLTGYDGRCDAVVLASALDWRPPEELNTIARLREQYGGVSATVRDLPAYDVVVIGGGLAGCTAAVAAARNGARVALIHDRPVLGGNASPEILVPPCGASVRYMREHPLDPRETGILDEYRTEGYQRVSEGKYYAGRLQRLVDSEPMLDLYAETHATGVEMADGPSRKITSVLALNIHTGERLRFRAHGFIDCSGDSHVGFSAGAEFRQGKEPGSMYGEAYAPEEASEHTMGNGLKYFARRFDTPQPFAAPPWAYSFPACSDFGHARHPQLTTGIEIDYQWKIELGGLRDTVADAEEIRDDLFRLIFGLWDHTKNHCDRDREQAANYAIVWLGYIAGKRENRRLIGDYVLTQNDIGNQVLFPDRVAFGAWTVDDHHSGGFFHDGSLGTHYDRPEFAYNGVPFSIPFRCLYSRNVENLLMAGRNISASHMAMSDTRVMLICAAMGHAAGTASAMCAHGNMTPRELCRQQISRLQQKLLKEGAAILELPADDPDDLAPCASVTASSTGVHSTGEVMVPGNVINGIDRAVGRRGEEVTNAWMPGRDIDGPHWLQLTWPEPVTFNILHVSFQTANLAPRRFAVEVLQDGEWVRAAEVSDNRHRRHVLGIDEVTTPACRIVLPTARAICEVRTYRETQSEVESARRIHANMMLPDNGPFLPWGDDIVPDVSHGLEGTILVVPDADVEGDWEISSWSGRLVGDGYYHDGNNDKGHKRIRFDLGSVPPGRYTVRLIYVACDNRSSRTPLTIHSAEGDTTVMVDQRRPGAIDDWLQPLGVFSVDGHSSLTISNTDTDGYVVVDAIQLVPVGTNA